MMGKTLVLMAITALTGLPAQAKAAVVLGTAGDFAVLAGTTVTNTGPTVIDGGHVGVSAGTAITGFFAIDAGSGIVTAPYTFHAANATAAQAQLDLTAAYDAAAGLAPTQSFLPAEDIGGLTLTPGVYFFPSSAFITGTLTLDAQGDPNAQFVFQIGSTLITATDASVVTINNGGEPLCKVFWQVGSSATLKTGTDFMGHILSLTSITMKTGATLHGSALARNGAVTLDSNTITSCAIPEPASFALVVLGSVLILSRRKDLRITSKVLTPAVIARSRPAHAVFAAVVIAVACMAPQAMAGTIFSHGDFTGNSLTYLDVRESSGTDLGPLYGIPTIAGDAMVWNPVGFNASSSGGTAPDVTDGTLAFTIIAHPGKSIPHIQFTESGDFTVVGAGTDITRASVVARVFITIMAVDGVGIDPITFNTTFANTPSSGVFNLTDFPSPGVANEAWHGTVLINLTQELANRNINGSATMVLVTLDNTLVAISESGTASFIAKKTLAQVLPEPSSLVLLFAGAALIAMRRRQQARA